MKQAKQHPAPCGNGSIAEFLPNLFVVEAFFHGAITITRTMAILRDPATQTLTLINSARLDEATEAELLKLGKISRVVRLTDLHGGDDGYYVEVHGAELYCNLPTRKNADSAKSLSDLELEGFDLVPIGCVTKCNEVAMVLQSSDGGVLFVGDCWQNHPDTPSFPGERTIRQPGPSRFLARKLGFKGGVIAPPLFFKIASPDGKPSGLRPGFEAVMQKDFRHVVFVHGPPVKDIGKELVQTCIMDKLFPPLAARDYPRPQTNGSLNEVLPDVFQVEGLFKIMPGVSIPRVMTVLRQGTDLTVFNSLRLDEATEARLRALGTIKRVVRLCDFHGIDDSYYVDKFQCEFFSCQPCAQSKFGTRPTPKPLTEMSIEGVDILNLSHEDRVRGEAVALLNTQKAVLVADLVQNNVFEPLPGEKQVAISGVTKKLSHAMGFGGLQTPNVYGKEAYRSKSLAAAIPELETVLALDFDHMLFGHGPALIGGAKATVTEQVLAKLKATNNAK